MENNYTYKIYPSNEQPAFSISCESVQFTHTEGSIIFWKTIDKTRVVCAAIPYNWAFVLNQ